FQQPAIVGRRPRLAGRRHDSGSEIPEHRVPELRCTQGGTLVREPVERDSALLRPQAVAAVTVLLEDRPDLVGIPRRGRILGRRTSGARGRPADHAGHREARKPAHAGGAAALASGPVRWEIRLMAHTGNHWLTIGAWPRGTWRNPGREPVQTAAVGGA